MSGEKTEKPTEQKKKKDRSEGKIARTPDLGAWAGMLGATILLPMTLGKGVAAAQGLLVDITTVISNPDPGDALALLSRAIREGAMAIVPLACGLLVIGLAAAAVQGGIHPAMGLLKPKFSRINPGSGFKRTLGPQAWWEGAKALIKTTVLGGVLYWSVRQLLPTLLASGSLPLTSLLDTVNSATLTLIRSAAGIGLVMAGLDYLVVRRRTDKQTKMSKQDIKEEYKRSEGDPQLKGAIRQKQLAISRNRMMTELPKADVIVVNPKHVAVALRYDPAKGAPRVIAKGADAIAAKIREVATECRIPMVQDVPLARALHKQCELGQEVPAELFGPVARVLAFVMTLKARGSAAGLHRRAA